MIGGAAWAEIRLSRITWGLGAESDAPEIATVPGNSEARCTTLTRAVAYRIDWLVSSCHTYTSCRSRRRKDRCVPNLAWLPLDE